MDTEKIAKSIFLFYFSYGSPIGDGSFGQGSCVADLMMVKNYKRHIDKMCSEFGLERYLVAVYLVNEIFRADFTDVISRRFDSWGEDLYDTCLYVYDCAGLKFKKIKKYILNNYAAVQEELIREYQEDGQMYNPVVLEDQIAKIVTQDGFKEIVKPCKALIEDYREGIAYLRQQQAQQQYYQQRPQTGGYGRQVNTGYQNPQQPGQQMQNPQWQQQTYRTYNTQPAYAYPNGYRSR